MGSLCPMGQGSGCQHALLVVQPMSAADQGRVRELLPEAVAVKLNTAVKVVVTKWRKSSVTADASRSALAKPTAAVSDQGRTLGAGGRGQPGNEHAQSMQGRAPLMQEKKLELGSGTGVGGGCRLRQTVLTAALLRDSIVADPRAS